MKTSRLFWFWQALVTGVLVTAAANSISYFVRSGGWGRLLGQSEQDAEAIGFPFEIWRNGVSYGAWQIDTTHFGWNALFALALGSILGVVAIAKSGPLSRFFDAMVEAEKQDGRTDWQFSVRGLFFMTLVAAVAAALTRSIFGPSPKLLAAIYLLGPSGLIALAMIPRRLNWQTRVIILTPATFVLIVFAVLIGRGLALELDRVVMGIYICWVPQTVLAAICLTVFLAIRYNARVRREQTTASKLAN